MTKRTNSIDSLREIFELARSISSVMDVDVLLRRIGGVAEKLLHAEASSIMLLDDDGQNLSFKVATGEKGGIIQKMKVPVGQGIAGAVARDHTPLVINDVRKDARFSGQTDKDSGFTTRSIIAVPLLMERELIGVMEVLNKAGDGEFTEEDRTVLESLASLAAVSINNARVAEDQRNFFANTLEILVTAIEANDPKMSGHAWNVAQLATDIGRQAGLQGQDARNLYYGALLHDIGFISSRGGITFIDGVITGRDRAPEMNHPKLGAEMVRNINLLKGAVPIIRHHHENFDGTGYPDGLAGENIPLGARIVALAEVVEEMRMSGIPDDRIRQMVTMGKETRFDPVIVDIYLKDFSEAKV